MDRSHRLRVYLQLLVRPIQTRFRYGSGAEHLNLQLKISRRIIMQKARSQAGPKTIALPQIVSTQFQVLFHSPPGVLFTFPSRYLFTIGHWRVFSLGGWSPRIPTGFHGSRSTQERTGRLAAFHLQDYHLLWCRLSSRLWLSPSFITPIWYALQPHLIRRSGGLGCSDFARHYFRNRVCFLFLQVLRWFSSLSVASSHLWIQCGMIPY